jgi:hypothetical protein
MAIENACEQLTKAPREITKTILQMENFSVSTSQFADSIKIERYQIIEQEIVRIRGKYALDAQSKGKIRVDPKTQQMFQEAYIHFVIDSQTQFRKARNLSYSNPVYLE